MTQIIDVKLIEDDEGVFDIALDENGDLLADYGFETTLRLSAFGRRRATEGEVPEPRYRGGWIGNLLSDIPGFEEGSKLWLLKQARLTTETANAAKSYLEEALEWLVEDGLARSVEISTEASNGTLTALITIDGEP
ncbi:MAG: phage GP46 family protein, partial [Phycisphaerales bacterium]